MRFSADELRDNGVVSLDISNIKRMRTGSLAMDAATRGGWPVGYFSSLSGMERSGKTTICVMTMMSLLQSDKDAWAAWVMAEKGFNSEMVYKTSGLKAGEDYALLDPLTGEDAVEQMRAMVDAANPPKLIILDSLVAMRPSILMSKDPGEKAIAAHAILVQDMFNILEDKIYRKGITVIFTNQIRDKVGGAPSNAAFNAPKPINRPGGHAKDFYTRMAIDMYPRYEKDEDSSDTSSTQQVTITKTLLKSGIKSLFFEGVMQKHTFGGLNLFNVNVAFYKGQLVVNNYTPTAELAKKAMIFTNKDGAYIAPGSHWYYQGKRIGGSRNDAMAWLAENPDIYRKIDQEIYDLILKDHDFDELEETIKASKKKEK